MTQRSEAVNRAEMTKREKRFRELACTGNIAPSQYVLSLDELRFLLDELSRLREASAWVSVGKGLPEPFTKVLAVHLRPNDERYIETTHHNPDRGWFIEDQSFQDTDVIYWMPLPELPNREGEEGK